MKILFAYENLAEDDGSRYQAIIDSAPEHIEIKPFCLSLRSPGSSLTWPQLNTAWNLRRPRLIRMYHRLQQAADGCDVFFNYNGANIHPQWLSQLDTFNVVSFCDTPDSPTHTGEHTSHAYDAVFHSNATERFQYANWGCRKLAYLPPFIALEEIPPREKQKSILQADRDVDLLFCHDRQKISRRREQMLCDAFSQVQCHGAGWSESSLDHLKRQETLLRTKISWKLHAFTGPWDNSLLEMAACGVLPICDNKTALGHLFCLQNEAVGYNTIPEAIELTRYFLAHEEERQQRAEATYHRFWRDYHPKALWKHLTAQIQQWIADSQKNTRQREPVLVGQESAVFNGGSISEKSPEIADAVASDSPAEDLTSQSDRLSQHNHSRKTNRLAIGPIKLMSGALGSTIDQVRPFGKRIEQAARKLRDGYKFAQGHWHSDFDERFYCDEKVPAYHENPEMRGVNMAQDRLDHDDPLDWPNILALNWAVTSLIGQARQIIEIGAGTGPFAEYASLDPDRQIHSFEDDDFAREAAIQRCSRPNIQFGTSQDIDKTKQYDLLVSIEVVEHVDDLGGFLRFCRPLAPRAIYSTPNRTTFRGLLDNGPPPYAPHVREYTTGEFYWVLRQHYAKVSLYYMPDIYVPWLQPMTLVTPGTPIIAVCRDPY